MHSQREVTYRVRLEQYRVRNDASLIWYTFDFVENDTKHLNRQDTCDRELVGWMAIGTRIKRQSPTLTTSGTFLARLLKGWKVSVRATVHPLLESKDPQKTVAHHKAFDLFAGIFQGASLSAKVSYFSTTLCSSDTHKP